MNWRTILDRSAWEEFALSLIFQIFLPLVPLGIELFHRWNEKYPSVDIKSLTIGASLYAVAVGVSSRNKLSFGLFFAVSFVCAIGHGLTFNVNPDSDQYRLLWTASKIALFGSIAYNVMERFAVHILRKEAFWVWAPRTALNSTVPQSAD